MSLGDRLKIIRGEIQQDEFAKYFNIHKNTYARYERNEAKPNTEFIKQLCLKFNVDVEWLIFGDKTVKIRTPNNIDISMLEEAIVLVEISQANTPNPVKPEYKAKMIIDTYTYIKTKKNKKTYQDKKTGVIESLKIIDEVL